MPRERWVLNFFVVVYYCRRATFIYILIPINAKSDGSLSYKQPHLHRCLLPSGNHHGVLHSDFKSSVNVVLLAEMLTNCAHRVNFFQVEMHSSV